MNENNKRDFELLSKFVEESLTSGGYIQGYMHSTLQLIQDNLTNTNKIPKLQVLSNVNQEQWTLKFRFHDGITCIVNNISPLITFEHLKLLVKDTYEDNINIEKFKSSDGKKEFNSNFDKQTISSCGIKNKDTLNVVILSPFSSISTSSPYLLSSSSSTQSSKIKSNILTKSNEMMVDNSKIKLPDTPPSTPIPVSGITRIMNSNVYPETSNQALFILLHSFMIDLGFIPITLNKSASGFAPAVRELPKDKFIPDNVFNDDNNMTLLYKHKTKPGKQYTLQLNDSNGDNKVQIKLFEKKGDKSDISLSVFEFIDNNLLLSLVSEGLFSAIGDVACGPYFNETLLKDHLIKLVRDIDPEILIIDDKSITNTTTNQSINGVAPLLSSQYKSPITTNVYYPQLPINQLNQQFHQPNKQYYLNNGPLVPRIGEGDIYPLPINPFPTGNLIGPGHPYFDQDIIPPQGGIPVLPQPRFDEFGPVVGPYGPNVGQPGGGFDNTNGIRGGRGRGRGRGGRLGPTGDPAPDHLQPPGWNNNDYI